MKKHLGLSLGLIVGLCGIFSWSAAAVADVHSESDSTPLVGVYTSVFGGGGSMMSGVDLVELATALYDTSLGGPIAVNAKGSSKSSAFWLVGGNIGFNWFTKPLNQTGINVSPSIELEGLYIGQHKIIGPHQVFPDHIHQLSFPTDIGIGLVNMVFDFSHKNWSKYHGYVGVGWGAAVVSISNAKATQISPAEPGINHFSGDSKDSGLAFAVQPKIGLLFDCNSRISLFAEYRFIYLSGSDYQFGSTVATGDLHHVVTTDWTVKIGSQLLNIGVVGLRFKL